MARAAFFSSLFHRGKRATVEAAPGQPSAAAPAGLRFEALLEAGPLPLVVHGPEGRLSDILNGGRIQLERTDGGEAPPLDDLLLVVAPPQAGDPRRRLHRPGRGVVMRMGSFAVTGEAHVPPGTQPTGFLLRTNPHFAPLTSVAIRSGPGAAVDRRVDVAIVNMRRVDSFRDATPEDLL